ncbi:hypothetical protein [Changchengzhania lutea]|uniref:hypothetical protein n=1 Tax=Changchengzhania lutea TaxID=2049305 RepID=UPI00115DEF45|nr:hypothetical protein [Changchengzhania lutea]
MKKLIFVLCIAVAIFSCKNDTKTISETNSKPLTIAEKIANAHGFKLWDKVSEIKFTFNVDRDSVYFERRWIWKPKTNEVILINKNDTISYIRTQIDSTNMQADQGFINDKFWLLVPYQLVWDTGTTITEPVKAESPISKTNLNKITLTYSNDGGYTPGDAYDLFYDDTFLIQEWIYRKVNATEPTMATTFENYKMFNGIKIATEHKKENANWNLNFTNIEVVLE